MEQPKSPEEPFLDGMALEDLDGAPLDIALDVKPVLPVEDLDGEDLTEDLDGLPCKSLSLWKWGRGLGCEYWDCLSVVLYVKCFDSLWCKFVCAGYVYYVHDGRRECWI